MEVAIYTDCQRLLNNFVKNGSPQFTVFREEWLALCFQYVYSAQTTTSELLQTTETILQAAKHALCVIRDDENRTERQLRHIGAIYLMYITYLKQPTKEYVKIEVSMKTWTQLQEIIRTIPKEIEFDDFRFVITKLIQANAFRFTAHDYCLGLENLVDYYKLFEDKDEMNEGDVGVHQKMKSFKKTQNLLPIFTILEDGYNEMKEQIIKTKGVDKKTLPPTTIFKEVNELFSNFTNLIENNYKVVQDGKQNEIRRQLLKRKGFTCGNNNKEKIKAKDNTNDEPSVTLTRRMSSKTIFTGKLPDEMLRDLDNTSSETEEKSMDDEDLEIDDI